MHHPTDRITHTTAFVTPVVEHWLKREIAQWVHPMKDRSDDPSQKYYWPRDAKYINASLITSLKLCFEYLYACFLLKKSNYIICFCSFYLSYPILETIILSKFVYYICLVFLNLLYFNLVKNASRFMCFSSPGNVTV